MRHTHTHVYMWAHIPWHGHGGQEVSFAQSALPSVLQLPGLDSGGQAREARAHGPLLAEPSRWPWAALSVCFETGSHVSRADIKFTW